MYNGGKNKVYQTIINQIPPHRIYIELCLGSGAVMRHKRPADINIGVDLLPGLTDKFNYPPAMIFLQQSIFDFLEKSNLPEATDTFIYIDPPYLFDTRLNQKQLYEHEFTEHDHLELLNIIRNLKCMVCISGYDSDIYNKILSDWRKVKYHTYDRQNRKRHEVLWCNYPEPAELHDYSHLGDDYIDRQRIKRKITRHINKLQALPLLERQAIIAAALEKL
jgi:DNA adenine methylase